VTQASKKRSSSAPLTGTLVRNIREIAVITLAAVAIFVAIALLTYQPADPGWSQSETSAQVQNSAGIVGAWIANILLYLFGAFGFLFPAICAFDGWRIFQSRRARNAFDPVALSIRVTGFLFTFVGGCALAWMHFGGGGFFPHQPRGAGGILGAAAGTFFLDLLGPLGSTLTLLALFLIGVTLYTELSWVWVVDRTGYWTLELADASKRFAAWARERQQGQRARKQRETVVQREKQKVEHRVPPKIETPAPEPKPGIRAEKEKQEHLFAPPADSVLPPLKLLREAQTHSGRYSREALEAMSRQVELKLRDFGIEVTVVEVHPGPVITRFELQPAPGVKGSQISNLAKDLARSLSVVSVRVVDVIPGKSVIGLEIPNEHREIVSLSEILNSAEYEATNSPLTLGLGKDISGKPVVMDLTRMPHLLVAGTTGSGKSVALNAMILSVLYKATARDVRAIMIDPKMLELSVYEGIPHLLTPVVTDMKESANALRWCVAEMERRYRLMATLGVRNIGGYNRKIKEAEASGKPLRDPLFVPGPDGGEAPLLDTLPFIVVIVDELADMMMTVGKKVEELIARLAQKARAAGIHLILATQRPSVDVITGLIKANIPCRIAFQVSARVDSRTILDQMGAESLLGHGDMLFLPPGTSVPERVHGAFVEDDEVHAVVENIKSRGEPEYLEDIVRAPGEGGAEYVTGVEAEATSEEADPLYDEAVRIVTQERKSSISYIQRRLKIGYNRAARMIEDMERSGLVGPLEANGNREILAGPPPPID
jgi:S-DNA-T family DNA segregation ATPase FtsK/SpoIIIE